MVPGSSSSRAWLWWVLGAGFLLAFGGLLTAFAIGPPGWLELGDKLGSVGGLVIGVTALLVSVVAIRGLVPGRVRSGVGGVTVLDEAAAGLGAQVRRQWIREMTVRLLDRPQPLRVRWSSTGRPVAARAEDVLAGAVAGRATRLHIRGDATGLVETFRRLPARQLVVLGQPGAGKTVLAGLLTTALLHDRHDQPVPVLLVVSSWNPAEPIDVWLARRIGEDYPFLTDTAVYGPDAAARLVAGQRVLPVLDGLDEMPAAWHARAIRSLNDVIGGSRPLVLTCRSDEYETAIAAAGTPLARAAVVEIEPVAASDAARFLPAGQLDGDTRWAPVIADLTAHPDGPLAAAMSTPLMVYLARTVYARAGSEPRQLCDRTKFPGRTAVESHLLDGYLPAVYNGRSATDPRHSADRAHRWLAFLAGHLDRLGTHDFAWWQLSSALRHRRLWFAVVLGVGTASLSAVLGALGGATAAVAGYPVTAYFSSYPIAEGAAVGVSTMILFAPIVGLVAGLAAVRAEAVIAVNPGVASRVLPIGRALAAGSIYALVLGTAAALMTTWFVPVDAAIWGAAIGLLVSLVPAERRFGDGRLRNLGRGLGQGVLLGLGCGAVDAASWMLDIPRAPDAVGLGVSCGVLAGIAVSRVADAVPRSHPRRVLAGVRRGLIGALALGLNWFVANVGSFYDLVPAAYGIAVGVGIVVPRVGVTSGRHAAGRAGRLLSAGRPALVAGLLVGPVLETAYWHVELKALAFGVLGMAVVWLAAASQDTGPGPRPGKVRRLRLLRDGVAAGVVCGCLLAVTLTLWGNDSTMFADVAPFVGLGIGLAATAAALATPAGDLDLVDPRSAVRSDRQATLVALAFVALAFVVPAFVALAFVVPALAPFALPLYGYSLGYGVAFGALVLLSLTFRSRWLEYTTARLLLTLQKRLPARLMPFLDDAHSRGVLRQVGAVYQLRHARLQAHLASRESAVEHSGWSQGSGKDPVG